MMSVSQLHACVTQYHLLLRPNGDESMALFIGVDDTDSATGMCTTYLLTELIRELDFPVLLGFPRLVRLNPNIPWKTRGNGALSMAIIGERSDAVPIGMIGGRRVMSSETPSSEAPCQEEVLEAASRVVERLAAFHDANTNPAVVVSKLRPDGQIYWKAVRELVSDDMALHFLSEAGGIYRKWKSGRGIIGATASISWVPRDRSYEIISYRQRERWGTAREVNAADSAKLSALFPSTFSNYDPVNRHSCIAPASPCPVLFGIRGNDPSVLESAMESVGSEPRDRWLIFETNQGTDDHITTPDGSLELFKSYFIRGTVAGMPRTTEGGHVFLELTTSHGAITCAAFEETKEFRNTVKQLIPGDTIDVWGSMKQGKIGITFNLEKMAVRALAKKLVKESNPSCPECGRRMHSAGSGAWYRCRACGTRSTESVFREEERTVSPGLYSVAASSRRHLSRPPEREAVYVAGGSR